MEFYGQMRPRGIVVSTTLKEYAKFNFDIKRSLKKMIPKKCWIFGFGLDIRMVPKTKTKPSSFLGWYVWYLGIKGSDGRIFERP